jgi:hypothetical protein
VPTLNPKPYLSPPDGTGRGGARIDASKTGRRLTRDPTSRRRRSDGDGMGWIGAFAGARD